MSELKVNDLFEGLDKSLMELRKTLDCLESTQEVPLPNGSFSQSYFKVGKNYFIRTVTMAHTGKLVGINATELLLEDACWIADTGRFYDALKTGVFDEIEPFVNRVIVNRGSIVDATIFDHPLPRTQK